MKTKIYTTIIVMLLTASFNKIIAQGNANTTLSNLVSPTSVNVSLVPKNKGHNLGSAAKSWKNIYLDSAVFLDGYRFLASKIGTGYDNTAVGTEALISNTSGYRNTANGYNAMRDNLKGIENTATGVYALPDNTSGSQNLAEGAQALNYNTTGDGNTAVGTYALVENKTGSYNVAVGYSAGGFAEKLNYIVAVGANALGYLNDDGNGRCTAIGDQAGFYNTSGSYNTYLGYHAGNTVTTGSSNTIIGYGADINNEAYNNATAIGNYAISGASNRVRIGNGSVTSIGGAVGWTNFSDERIKTNIKQDVPGLAFINLLKPVTYNFDISKEEQIFKRKDSAEWKEKYDIQKIKFTGFLAQQVEAAAKKLNYDFSGVDMPKNDKDVYGLRYSDFVVPLVKAVQELSARNDSLQNQNINQQDQINNLQQEIDDLKKMMIANLSMVKAQQSAVISSASLSQNIPNPFSNSTTINYSIPQHFSSAKIIVTDKNGNALKQINLPAGRQGLSSNKGSITIDAATFSSGAYQYSLYVDGKLIASKQMVLSR